MYILVLIFNLISRYPLPTLGAEDYDTPGPEVPDNEPTRPGDLYEAGLHERFLVIQECFGPRQ